MSLVQFRVTKSHAQVTRAGSSLILELPGHIQAVAATCVASPVRETECL